MKKLILLVLLLCGIGFLNAQHQQIKLWKHGIGKSVWPTKMYCYHAPDSINTGVAVIVCPGGSYSHLMGIKTEDRLSTSAAANSEILFSLMVNPSVLGAGMPGGPYAGNAGSGSDIREGLLVSLILNYIVCYNVW